MAKQSTAEHLRDHRFQGDGIGIKHSHAPVSVNLPSDLDRYVRSKQNRSDWLRSAIEAAARAEGWAASDDQTQANPSIS